MAEGPTPTSSGPHNHVSPLPRDYQSRGDVDKIFGVDAKIIEGLPIEQGSGCLLLEWQLAEHVMRIYHDVGDDAAWAMRDRLLVANGVNRAKLERELIVRDLLPKKGVSPS
jgi:hypothetical protein